MRRIIFGFVLAGIAVSAVAQMLWQPSAESDTLFASGVDLYNEGKYREAIQLFAKSDSLDKTLVDSLSHRSWYAKSWLASCHYKLGDTTNAIKYDSLYYLPPIDRRLTRAADSVFYIGDALYADKKYKEAVEKYGEAVSLIKRKLGNTAYYIGSPLAAKALSEYYSGDLYRAIDDWIEVYGIFQADSIFTSTYKTIWYNISFAISNLENEKQSFELINKLVNYTRNPYAKVVISYRLADCYSKLHNYNMAVQLGEIAKSACESIAIEDKKLYGNKYGSILSNLAWDYSHLGNDKAVSLQSMALDIWKLYNGEYSKEYAYGCKVASNINYKLGNIDSALYFADKAIEIYDSIGKDNIYYKDALLCLIDINMKKGNISEAKNIAEKTVNFTDSVFGEDSIPYLDASNSLGLMEWECGNYTKAVEIGEKILQTYRTLYYYDDDKRLCHILDNLALYYSSLGNNAKALALSEWSIRNKMSTADIDSISLATTLRNYAGYLYLEGRYDDAVKISLDALSIMKKCLGECHYDYLITYANLSRYLFSLKRYDDAIRIAEKARDLIVSNIGDDNTYCDVALRVLADSYFEKGKSDAAINILERLSEQKFDRYGGFTLNGLSEKNRLLNIYLSLHRHDAVPLCAEISNMLEKNILMSFSELTSYERSLFWSRYGEAFYAYFQPLALYRFPMDSLARCDAYDGVLLSKGILLNSDIELSKLIAESGDSLSVAMYRRLRGNRMNLAKLYERPVTERLINTDSLTRIIETQEKELLRRSKIFGDYTKNLSVKWTGVRDKLNKDELAVEFLSFHVNNDSTMYVALTLKKGYDSPKMVPLFEEKQLKDIDKGLFLSSDALYNLVWKPLEGEMESVSTVYFAPAGELYNIPVENLPIDGNTYNSDIRDYRRLSSTRQLALRRDDVEVARAAVYGGLKYDTDTVTLANDSRKYRAAEPAQWPSRAVADSLNLRSGVSELPATKIEAEEIDKALETARIDTKLYIDTIGTEASFKALSGKGVNALHIATHGFYWTEREATQLDGLAFLGTDMPTVVQEDKALTRSGLLFAGANTALKGLPLPEGVEDGVLTAKEIAGMDLRRLDLVALSACQTGLGEITGDGVFGLQRGFKKAGANTLLMSLWKVDDTATQLLMTQFYKNLLSGMGKYEALAAAQKYLRELEVEVKITPDKTNYQRLKDERAGKQEEAEYKTVRRYAEPKYWAAFVLLDGVD